MTNEHQEELLSAYLDGELTAAEQADVEKQLAESAEFRQLHDELRALRSSFEALPRYSLPEDLSHKILRRAEIAMLSGAAESKTPESNPNGANKSNGAPGKAAAPAAASKTTAPKVTTPMVTLPSELAAPLSLKNTWRRWAGPALAVAAAVLIMIFNPAGKRDEVKVAMAPARPLPEGSISATPAGAGAPSGPLEFGRQPKNFDVDHDAFAFDPAQRGIRPDGSDFAELKSTNGNIGDSKSADPNGTLLRRSMKRGDTADRTEYFSRSEGVSPDDAISSKSAVRPRENAEELKQKADRNAAPDLTKSRRLNQEQTTDLQQRSFAKQQRPNDSAEGMADDGPARAQRSNINRGAASTRSGGLAGGGAGGSYGGGGGFGKDTSDIDSASGLDALGAKKADNSPNEKGLDRYGYKLGRDGRWRDDSEVRFNAPPQADDKNGRLARLFLKDQPLPAGFTPEEVLVVRCDVTREALASGAFAKMLSKAHIALSEEVEDESVMGEHVARSGKSSGLALEEFTVDDAGRGGALTANRKEATTREKLSEFGIESRAKGAAGNEKSGSGRLPEELPKTVDSKRYVARPADVATNGPHPVPPGAAAAQPSGARPDAGAKLKFRNQVDELSVAQQQAKEQADVDPAIDSVATVNYSDAVYVQAPAAQVRFTLAQLQNEPGFQVTSGVVDGRSQDYLRQLGLQNSQGVAEPSDRERQWFDSEEGQSKVVEEPGEAATDRFAKDKSKLDNSLPTGGGRKSGMDADMTAGRAKSGSQKADAAKPALGKSWARKESAKTKPGGKAAPRLVDKHKNPSGKPSVARVPSAPAAKPELSSGVAQQAEPVAPEPLPAAEQKAGLEQKLATGQEPSPESLAGTERQKLEWSLEQQAARAAAAGEELSRQNAHDESGRPAIQTFARHLGRINLGDERLRYTFTRGGDDSLQDFDADGMGDRPTNTLEDLSAKVQLADDAGEPSKRGEAKGVKAEQDKDDAKQDNKPAQADGKKEAPAPDADLAPPRPDAPRPTAEHAPTKLEPAPSKPGPSSKTIRPLATKDQPAAAKTEGAPAAPQPPLAEPEAASAPAPVLASEPKARGPAIVAGKKLTEKLDAVKLDAVKSDVAKPDAEQPVAANADGAELKADDAPAKAPALETKFGAIAAGPEKQVPVLFIFRVIDEQPVTKVLSEAEPAQEEASAEEAPAKVAPNKNAKPKAKSEPAP